MGKITLRKAFKKAPAKVLNFLLLFSLIVPNVLSPAIVIAQELDIEQTEIVEEIPIDESEDILEEGISTSIFEEGVYTVSLVEEKEYVYPDDDRVRIRFTSITEEGNLVIQKVVLTEEEKTELNTTEEYGWNFTSTMSNGSFTYDLVLPNEQGEEIEVKYTEDGNTYKSVDRNVEVNSDVVNIEGLEHFTIFVVSGLTTPPTCNGASITPPSGTTKCYSTITDAINAAIDGDTIHVAAGTYNENLKLQGKNLTLRGPHAGVSASDPSRRVNEAVIKSGGTPIAVEISGEAEVTVTVDGFTIADDSNWSAAGIAQKSSSPQVTSHILNNIVEAPISTNINGNSIQISGNNSSIIGNLVQVTTLTNPNWSATGLLVTTASNTTVKDNIIIGNGATVSDNGIVIINYSGSSITNNLIQNNYIENCNRPISIQPYYGDISNIVIKENTIKGGPIGLTFTDFNKGHIATYNEIKDNTFSNNDIQVNANNISGINLDYILENNVFDKAVIRRNNTPLTYTGNKIYSSIQGAVDDANDGDTVNVLPGTYNENVSINKGITLKAVENEKPVINGGIYLDTSNITIDGFQIMSGAIVAHNQKAGIYIKGGTLEQSGTSNQKIINNTLVGTGKNQTDGPAIMFGYYTRDILVQNNMIKDWYQGLYINPSSNLEILNNTFESNYVGIGSDGLNSVNILGNTFKDNTLEAIGSSNVRENVKVNRNSFEGNTSGVNWYSGNTIDAKENWWGDITGPSGVSFGKGDKVSSNVDICPWLKSEGGDSVETCNATIPIVNINSPSDNAYVNGGLEVEVEASDDWGMGSYYIRLWKNAPYEVFIDECRSAPGGTMLGTSRTDTCTFDTTTLIDGETYYITAQYLNTLTKWGSDVISIKIDNSYPNILDTKMFVEKNGSWKESSLTKSGDNVKIAIEVEDALTEVEKVQLWIRENPWNLNNNELISGTMNKVDGTHFEFIYTVPSTYKNGDPINENFEGNYFNFRPWDSLGNSHIGWSMKFTIDNTAPTKPTATLTANGISVPTNGYTSSETFTFNLSSSEDTTRYQLKYWNEITDSPFKEDTPWNPTNLSAYSSVLGVYNDKFTQGEGEHSFSFSACDLAGNCSAYSTQFVVTYDKTAPTISNVIVDKTFVKAGDTITITADVTDNNGVLAVSADFSYNESYTSRPIPTSVAMTKTSGNTYQAKYTVPSSWTNGTMYVKVAARDLTGGNWIRSTGYKTLSVDNIFPTIQSLEDFTINEGSTIPTKEVLVEDNYEIEKLCYSITSDIGDVSEECITPSTSTDSWNVDLTDTILTELSTTYGITTTVADTSLIPEGDYTISYFAKDKAGNSSSIEEVIVTIVNVEPTVLFSSSTTEILAGNSISFNGSFIDPGLDDSNWTYTLSFGDGTPDVLGTLPAQGNILTNYLHTYTTAGDYIASLEVCEDGGVICTTETIDISVGAVQGVTSESSTTTTNSPTLAKKVTTFFADILGVGGEGDALALENEEEILNEDTEEVKGSQTCDNPSTISGYIYIDSNNDGIKDEGERVFSEISIRVYTITDGMEETVKQLITDENGYWETTLCSGQYFVKVDDSKLPNNFVLGENDQEIQIEEEEDTSLDFTVLDERNFLQKYWPWILLAVGILGSIGIVALDTKRKKEYI